MEHLKAFLHIVKDPLLVEVKDRVRGGEALGKEWKLPVLWHQCLLAFAQRYRNDITEDQREALLDLLLVRGHKAIGPEVRREEYGKIPKD